MSPAIVTLMAFLAAAMLVVGLYSILSDLFLRDRSRVSQRVDDEFRKVMRERAKRSALFKNQHVLTSPEDEANASGLGQRLEVLIEQSGLELSPRRLLTVMSFMALLIGPMGGLLRQSVLLGAVLAVVGASLPLVYVAYKRKVRLEKLTTQLPDAFDLMARVIRAGQTISQALQSVADEFTAPIAAEFAYACEQQNLGLSAELSLRDLARRTGVLEIKIFVLALLIQHQTGGNLAEVLDNLATIVRERFRIRGKIRALTAEGRLQAVILLALPPAMFLLILFLNRPYGEVLLEYPSLLVGMVVAEVLGALWIRTIVNFDF